MLLFSLFVCHLLFQGGLGAGHLERNYRAARHWDPIFFRHLND